MNYRCFALKQGSRYKNLIAMLRIVENFNVRLIFIPGLIKNYTLPEKLQSRYE